MAEETIKGRGANTKLIALTIIVLALALAGYIWFAISTGSDAEQKQIAPETSAPQRAPSANIPPVGYGHLKKPEVPPPAPAPAPAALPPIRQEPIRQNVPPTTTRQPTAQKPPEAKKLPSMLFGGEADFGGSRAADNRGPGVTMAASPGAQADQLPEYARQGLAQDKRHFLNNAGQLKGFVTNPLMPPISDMMLQAGKTIIPVVVINGVTTDLPGHIVGQVTHDVKDSITGTCILIPATSTLIGPVNHQVAYGAERMQPAWNRIMFPNGASQDIDIMPATDATGKAGIEGRVNRHTGTMALAIAGDIGLRVVGQAGQLFGSGGEMTIIGLGAGAAGGSINDVGREIVRKELDRPNEITLEPGDPVSLMLIEDIALPPYNGECS